MKAFVSTTPRVSNGHRVPFIKFRDKIVQQGQLFENATVVSINHIGAFVDLGVGKEGLIRSGYKHLRVGSIVTVQVTHLKETCEKTPLIYLKLKAVKKNILTLEELPPPEEAIIIGHENTPYGRLLIMQIRQTKQRVLVPNRLITEPHLHEGKFMIIRTTLLGPGKREYAFDKALVPGINELFEAIGKGRSFKAKPSLSRLTISDLLYLQEERWRLPANTVPVRLFAQEPISNNFPYYPEGIVLVDDLSFRNLYFTVKDDGCRFKLSIRNRKIEDMTPMELIKYLAVEPFQIETNLIQV